MARSVKAVRDWLAFLNSEDSVAVYGQGSGAALVHCEGSNFMQIGGEIREKRERYDAQPLQLAISKLRNVQRWLAEFRVEGHPPSLINTEIAAVLECLEDGELPQGAEPDLCDYCHGLLSSRIVRSHSVYCSERCADLGKGAANAPVHGPSADPVHFALRVCYEALLNETSVGVAREAKRAAALALAKA